MVGRGRRFFYVGNETQLFDNLTFEIASLVAIETRGKAGGGWQLKEGIVPTLGMSLPGSGST